MSTSYTKYGDYSGDSTEFIITNPDTPRPWINYLSNGKYCALVSQTGGGYSFYLDSGVNRITRWLPENYLKDIPGRTIYLRDETTKEFWSTGYRPAKKSNGYECRHGLGYTVLKNRFQDIESEMTVFVPQGESFELWITKIKNVSQTIKTLRLFPFVEWLIGDWMTELSIRNISILLNEGYFNKDHQVIVARKFPWVGKEYPYIAFLGSGLNILGHDVDYENFIGRYRDVSNPIVVENGRCSQSRVRGVNMVGVLEHELKLEAGEEREFVVVMGIVPSKENEQAIAHATKKCGEIVKKFTQIETAKQLLESTKSYWKNAILKNVMVKTPDEILNRSINVWMKYQIYMNNHWGRSATFYHEGGGEFGYRNTAQDAWSMVPLNAEYAKERLIFLCKHQKKSGQPLPGWSLATGPSTHKPPSDFPIWLPMLLIAYVKETGDLKLLEKRVPYHDGGMATIYEHAKKATKFLQDIAKSKRGIPLMGTQDWNDAFDRTGIGGKGESVWLGMGLCVALRNLEELAFRIGDKNTALDCQKRYKKMKEIINRYAWDGDWYRYAFNDYGKPIGSKKNQEGKIQLNAQTWAIIAGIPEEKKLAKILKVIDQDLDTPYGPVLFTPPYTKYDKTIGRITAFAPGTKENAAIFCHGGAFKIYADLQIGRADEAYETLKKILPSASNKDIELYKTEPYVFAEYLIGPGNPCYGEGAFSWLTGSVDWIFVSVIEGLLGIKPDYDGLRVDPCLPSSWEKVEVTRYFRDSVYEITILNPDHVTKGIRRIVLDKNPLDSNLVPPFKDGRVHLVEVTMGKKL